MCAVRVSVGTSLSVLHPLYLGQRAGRLGPPCARWRGGHVPVCLPQSKMECERLTGVLWVLVGDPMILWDLGRQLLLMEALEIPGPCLAPWATLYSPGSVARERGGLRVA